MVCYPCLKKYFPLPQQLDFLSAHALSIAEVTKNWNLCIETLQTLIFRPRISSSFYFMVSLDCLDHIQIERKG